MLKARSSIEELSIAIDGRRDIPLQSFDCIRLHHLIGREQEKIRADSDSPAKGGNRTKRILLHHPNADRAFWNDIANASHLGQQIHAGTKPSEAPSDDSHTLLGTTMPKAAARTVVTYARDPKVVVWVIAQAQGICEFCGSSAPFHRSDGTPYLEVHHVRPLAAGGSDTTTNTVAVCPNCHRRFHHAANPDELITEAIQQVDRLIDER
ncbi:HNH endonuclease [Kushneria phosphatilytica]|uniref:HNH endonuclease n=2 Tax=Kushneria phosphatilytica TaxID=657387 RepID=A0A5C1A5I6_9GAMM|nr:HNH endonuclease [Kushneria phosphatilytica]